MAEGDIEGQANQRYLLPGLIRPFHDLPPGSPIVPEVPKEQQDKQIVPPPLVRGRYISGLNAGTTLGPDDFHDAYHMTGNEPLPGLASQLPSAVDWIDSSINALKNTGLPMDRELLEQTKQNLMNHYVTTGERPQQVLSNPDLTQRMTRDNRPQFGAVIPYTPPQDLLTQTGLTPEEYNVFRSYLAHRESGSYAEPPNSGGYMGRYQMSMSEIKATADRLGIPAPSQEQFLSDPKLQEQLFASYILDHHEALMKNPLYAKGDPATKMALLAGAHLGGPGGVAAWQRGEDRRDSNGTSVSSYINGMYNAATGGTGGVQIPVDRSYDPASGSTLAMSPDTIAAIKKYLQNSAQGLAEGGTQLAQDLHDILFPPEIKPKEPGEPTTMDKFSGLLDLVSAGQMSPLAVKAAGGAAIAGSMAGDALRGLWMGSEELAKTQAAEAFNALGKEVGETAIRAATGLARRATAEASEILEGFRAMVAKHVPEFEEWLSKNPGVDTPMWPAPAIMNMIDDMERATATSVARTQASINEEIIKQAHELLDTISKTPGVDNVEVGGMTYTRQAGETLKDFAQRVREQFGLQNIAEGKFVVPGMSEYGKGGAGGARLDPNSPLVPLMAKLRALYQQTRQAIEREFPDMVGFIEDYYRHLWTDPHKMQQMFNVGRTGSGASMRARSWPTIAEGIQRGGKPVFTNPIENILHYIAGMRQYLATRQILRSGEEMGLVKWSNQHRAPVEHQEWVPLKYQNRSKLNTTEIEQAYAPKGFADAYNSLVGKGFYDMRPGVGKLYDAVQKASNMSVAMKLAISGYHYWNVSVQAVHSSFSVGLGELATGDLIQGLRDIGYGAAIIPAFVKGMRQGKNLQNVYLSRTGSALEEKVMNLLSTAGARVVGRGMEYGYRQNDNLVTAFKRGTLGFETKHDLGAIIGETGEQMAKRIGMAGPRAAGFFAHEISRVISTISSPLFDKIVPRLKTSAAFDELSAWLRANPTAGERTQVLAAQRIWDSMDDRFGEMVQDNLFWPRMLKQSLNTLTVSVGWEWGSLRAFAGGAKALMKGNVLDPKARWLLTWPLMTAYAAGIYQYLKTGTISEPNIRDQAFPLTGGKTPEGAPERAVEPGYTSLPIQIYRTMTSTPDWRDYPSAVANFAGSRANPFWQMIWHAGVTARDWNGNPLFDIKVPDPKTHQVPTYWDDLMSGIEKTFEPIPLQQNEQRLRGTNITRAEQFLGLRAAPDWAENPERQARIQKRALQSATKRAEKAQAHHQNRLEQPNK